MYQSVPTVWTPRPSSEIAAINILDLPIFSIQGFVETHRGCSTINKKTWCISYLAMIVLKNNDKNLYFLLLHQLYLEKVLHFEKKKVWAPSDFVSTNKAGKGLDPTPSIYIYNEFCWFASFINIIFDFSVRIVCGSCLFNIDRLSASKIIFSFILFLSDFVVELSLLSSVFISS